MGPQADNAAQTTQPVRRPRKRKPYEDQEFHSPAGGSPTHHEAPPPPPPPPPQHPQSLRMSMVIVPSPQRVPKRGKRVTAFSPAAGAPSAAVTRAGGASASSIAAAQAPQSAVHQRAAPPPNPAAPQQRAAPPVQQAAPPAAAVQQAVQPPLPPNPPAPQQQDAVPASNVDRPRKRQRRDSTGGSSTAGTSRGTKRGRQRKTLTAKGKKAAVMGVLASSEVQRAASTGAAGAPSEQPQQQQQQPQQPQPPQQAQPSQPAAAGGRAGGAAAAAAAGAAAAAAGPAENPGTAKWGQAWSKADISTLARLAVDREFLLLTIPSHPVEGELDWELISLHFGRYSRGGNAVKHQYNEVMRLMKQARHEGRKGASYVDLVQAALASLPGRQGTVFDVQRVLKQDSAASLDKYRDKRGAVRWKTAVREVLKDQPSLFEQAGKTATNKIIWRLREAAAT